MSGVVMYLRWGDFSLEIDDVLLLIFGVMAFLVAVGILYVCVAIWG